MAKSPYYSALLEKRGRQLLPAEAHAVAGRFTVDEIRDLQVLFNLGWFGIATAQDPQIQRLLEQGKGYTEADKDLVLTQQHQILQRLLPAWKQLVASSAVEICGSPYYQGLLPLLIDSNTARRASPETSLPERFAFPADAEAQISLALARLQEEFGTKPAGLWPPEGAISPETVRLAQKQGLKYLTTDSELLFHSLDNKGSTPGKTRQYQPYRVDQCAVFFSDSRLSRLVEKEYAGWENSAAAASDLIRRIRAIGQTAQVDGQAPPLIAIAVNGENPWEAYPRRGYDFLSALYQQLGETEEIKTVTLAEHLRAHPPTVELDYLHSGSRIEGNFAVWIGNPEKNRAWNLLTRARKRLARAQISGEADEAVLQRALTQIYRAESSDWLWWLGEPFSSAEEGTYQGLFRGQLKRNVPHSQRQPTGGSARPVEIGEMVEPLRQPTAYIQPRIDGTRTSFYEWRGAGFYYRPPAAGSLFQKHTFISGLYWGFDAGRLYLRIDPLESHPEGFAFSPAELSIWIELTTAECSFKLELSRIDPLRLSLTARHGDTPPADLGTVEEAVFKEVFEMAIPLSRLGLQAGNRLGLTLHFARGGQLLSLVPRQGVIEVVIPDGDFDFSF